MDVRERPQQVVSFVSFDELDTQEPPAEAPRTVRIGGMDLQLDVDISDDVRAGVDLSADGQNRVDLEGGGRREYLLAELVAEEGVGGEAELRAQPLASYLNHVPQRVVEAFRVACETDVTEHFRNDAVNLAFCCHIRQRY